MCDCEPWMVGNCGGAWTNKINCTRMMYCVVNLICTVLHTNESQGWEWSSFQQKFPKLLWILTEGCKSNEGCSSFFRLAILSECWKLEKHCRVNDYSNLFSRLGREKKLETHNFYMDLYLGVFWLKVKQVLMMKDVQADTRVPTAPWNPRKAWNLFWLLEPWK